jgi:hypothetical protein
VTWGVPINLGSRSRPKADVVWVEPLPSGIPSVVVALRPSKAPSVRRRLERLFQRRVGRDADGRPAWGPIPSRRAVAWRHLSGPRGAEWWVCGPLAWGADQYLDVVQTITRRDPWRAASLLHRRQLLIVDTRTGAEVALTPPLPPAAPLDEDDDDNAVLPELRGVA